MASFDDDLQSELERMIRAEVKRQLAEVQPGVQIGEIRAALRDARETILEIVRDDSGRRGVMLVSAPTPDGGVVFNLPYCSPPVGASVAPKQG
jgi:hypothetical protein